MSEEYKTRTALTTPSSTTSDIAESQVKSSSKFRTEVNSQIISASLPGVTGSLDLPQEVVMSFQHEEKVGRLE